MNWNALSDITPLHKKDSKSLSENYRPISLTSIICEIGEKFVFDWMHTFWQETGLINNNQFGFLKGLDPPSSQWMTGLNRVICLAQRRWFSLTWPSYAKVLLTSASRCSWKASVLTAACMPGSGTSWQDAGSALTEGNYVWLVVSYGLMYFRIAYKCLLGTSCLKVFKVSLPERFGWANYYVLRISLNWKKKRCSQRETSHNQSVRTGFSLICFDRLHKFWVETGLINNNHFGFL